MDPVVSNKFDEICRKLDEIRSDFQSSTERVERRVAEAEEIRLQRTTADDARLTALENFASAEYTAAIIADNWGGHFEERVSDLEQRVVNLELVRYVEIQDERDERVAALESAASAFEGWKSRVESSLFFLRSDVDRINRIGGRPVDPSAAVTDPDSVAGRASAGDTTEWPNGHRVALTPRDMGHGSFATMAPIPANE